MIKLTDSTITTGEDNQVSRNQLECYGVQSVKNKIDKLIEKLRLISLNILRLQPVPNVYPNFGAYR